MARVDDDDWQNANDAVRQCATVDQVHVQRSLSMETVMHHRQEFIPGGPQKTSRTLPNYNCADPLWREISFCTFVDQDVQLLTYKFQ